MDNYAKARSLIEENLDALNALAGNLLEKEVLDGPEIDRILGEHRQSPPADPPAAG